MTRLPGKVVARDRIDPVRWTVEEGRIFLRSQDTGGQFSLFELNTPPGGGPPLHLHDALDETFCVIEGVYEIQLGGNIYTAVSGAVVFGPRGVGHGFRNVGVTPARMLCISTPGGSEAFFEGLAEILQTRTSPGSAIKALVAEHGITYLGEPGEPLRGTRIRSS